MKTITKNCQHHSKIQWAQTQSGFTLIELMVTVTILAILVSIAVPAMTNFMNSNRLTSHTSALKQAIQYARSEAVSKNQDVSICASSDGATCTDNAEWSQGWIVFTDADGAGDVDIGTDTVLRVWQGLSDRFTLTGAPIIFESSGQRSTTVPVSFVVTDPGLHTRTLAVSNVGWVTVTKGGGS